MSSPALRSSRGFAAAEWAVALGLLILPVVMIVGSIAPWMARQTMAREISQEAARTIALAPDWGSGAVRAEQVAAGIAANYGLGDEDWSIVSMEPGAIDFGRGTDVVVEIRVRVPALTVPGIGSVAEVWWHAEHVEHVDDFRSFP